MVSGKIPKERLYSDFWSNREYLFVHEGELTNQSVPSHVRRKMNKIINGLKEIQNPAAVDAVTLADLINAVAHVMEIVGFDKESKKLNDIAENIRETIKHTLSSE